MSAIIILEDEPLAEITKKWVCWITVMVVFVMALIYFSNYFARGTECFIIDEYHTGHPTEDLRKARWRRRFDQVDALTYV